MSEELRKLKSATSALADAEKALKDLPAGRKALPIPRRVSCPFGPAAAGNVMIRA